MKNFIFLTETDLADVFQPDQPNHDSIKIEDIDWHHFKHLTKLELCKAWLAVFHNRKTNEFKILKNYDSDKQGEVVDRATAVKVIDNFCKHTIK